MCGRQSRCTSACTPAAQPIGTTRRTSVNWPGRRTSAHRSCSERERPQHGRSASLTASSCARRPPASTCGGCSARSTGCAPRPRSGHPRCAGPRPRCRVEDQLDGVDHQPARLVTHCASNAAALIDSNSAALIAPAPAGSTARTGATGPARRDYPSRPHPGRAATRRSPARHTEYLGRQALPVSTRCGSTCPGPAETTTSTGAARSQREVTQRHPAVTQFDQQPTRTLDQGQLPPRPLRPTPPARRASAAPCLPARAAAGGRQRFGIAPRAVQRAHPGQPRRHRRGRRRGGCRSAPACTPRRRCPRAGRDRPGPRWRPSCRRRCRCR